MTKTSRTIGPVEDLERHLPERWWETLFGSLYLKTDGDVVENAENTAKDVDLLVEGAALSPSMRVLDLCCGQGRHAIELARRGYLRVSGLDQAKYLVRLARKRAGEAGLKVRFIVGDAFALPFGDASFGCVAIMGNSFGYFADPDDDRNVLSEVFRVLEPGGKVALDITDGDWMREHYERRSWEWIDADYLACRERQMSADASRLICRELVVHSRRGIVADQFYAIRYYSAQRIEEELAAAGFSDVRHLSNHGSLSDRNQDLGFMENRMFVVARKPE
jgi:D-alanine-D-alanine ligase